MLTARGQGSLLVKLPVDLPVDLIVRPHHLLSEQNANRLRAAKQIS